MQNTTQFFVVAKLKIPGLELIDHNWSFIMSLNVMQVFLTLTNFLVVLELQIFLMALYHGQVISDNYGMR